MSRTFDVAVVGATGAVGETMIAILEERAVTPHLIATSGADNTPVEHQLLKLVETFNQEQEDYELVFGTPTESSR